VHGHWFVVASQKTVRIFTEVSERNRLKQLQEFDNPLGRERNRALVRKQAGLGVKSAGQGSVHYSEKKRHDPHEEAAVQFAKKVCNFLESEFQNKKFKSLTIVAEPHFIGKLRTMMKPALQKFVTEWIKKDLLKTPYKELVCFLLPTKRDSATAASLI
jgi:protein required for attachment to host cells